MLLLHENIRCAAGAQTVLNTAGPIAGCDFEKTARTAGGICDVV